MWESGLTAEQIAHKLGRSYYNTAYHLKRLVGTAAPKGQARALYGQRVEKKNPMDRSKRHLWPINMEMFDEI